MFIRSSKECLWFQEELKYRARPRIPSFFRWSRSLEWWSVFVPQCLVSCTWALLYQWLYYEIINLLKPPWPRSFLRSKSPAQNFANHHWHFPLSKNELAPSIAKKTSWLFNNPKLVLTWQKLTVGLKKSEIKGTSVTNKMHTMRIIRLKSFLLCLCFESITGHIVVCCTLSLFHTHADRQ